MTCSVPNTYDEIKSMVEKQIQEDQGCQLSIMNLGHQFDNAITSKDELQKAYEECRDIPREQRTKIENFLNIKSELDHQMQNASFRKVKENSKKDKVGSKPDKNEKRGEAGKSQKQLQWIEKEIQKKTQKEGPKMQSLPKFIKERRKRDSFAI
nr:hypothetical protein [Tanacetum cinerariifolium]